jgi:DNA processing protein
MTSGINHIYPPENKALYDSIAKQSSIITEQPFGKTPHARSFPGRNRIISGISLGVAVVEASLKSGSLITARFTLDQDREVFAVPGSPKDPRCKGANGLIKQGAIVCESVEDIMAVFNREPPLFMAEQESGSYEKPPFAPPQESDLAEARKLIHSKLGYAPVAVDEMLIQTQITPNILSLVLLELELAGRLNRHTGHKVSLKAEAETLLA